MQRQLNALVPFSPRPIYVVGDNCNHWRDMARARRPGDIVVIEALCLLAEPKSKTVRWPSQDLRDAIEQIEKRGATILEAMTGLTTADCAQRKTMIAEAVRALGAGQRSLPSDQARENGKRGGRREKQFDAATLDKAERVWKNLVDYPTWQEAAKGMPKGFTVYRAHRLWGERGELLRKPKRRT